MRLTIKIENQDALANGQELIKILDRKGLQIGRAADVDWQLPDPAKLISSIHAEIRFRDGVYTLRDKSRNGTFLNGARIDSANREARLTDGDRIAIGHYELSVRIAGEDPQLAPIDKSADGAAGGEVVNDAATGESDPHGLLLGDGRTPRKRGAKTRAARDRSRAASSRQVPLTGTGTADRPSRTAPASSCGAAGRACLRCRNRP